MQSDVKGVLVVDDDPAEHISINKLLRSCGYDAITVFTAAEAVEVLAGSTMKITAILLDWDLPDAKAKDLLSEIKSNEYRAIPVIISSDEQRPEQLLAAVELGVYQILSKPLDPMRLMVTLENAAEGYQRHLTAHRQLVEREHDIRAVMHDGTLRFRTLSEARIAAEWFSGFSAERGNTAAGLAEIFINAIEHGNLGIGYEEKTRMLSKRIWSDEITARLALPEHASKAVTVVFRKADDLVLDITDCGMGFDFSRYLDFDLSRMFDMHGKGIAMAKQIYLKDVHYHAPGNHVTVRVHLHESLPV